MKLDTRDIALAGVLSAVCIILAVTRVGYIPFFAGTSVTIMHLPVIIGAVVGGPVVGTIISLIFGVSSLILSSVSPTGPGDVFFTDPWVSVMPRLFLGLIAWAVYRSARASGRAWVIGLGVLLSGLVILVSYNLVVGPVSLGPVIGVVIGGAGLAVVGGVVWRAFRAHPEELALSSAAVAATVSNTVLVLGALVVRGYIPRAMAFAIGAANSPLEMVAAAVITVAVVSSWHQISLRPGGSTV
ncbi:MAG: ECF transporter S component [Anaerolineae bacterium]|nr:ECF transporter S component [Anaerolineae bacterium]